MPKTPQHIKNLSLTIIILSIMGILSNTMGIIGNEVLDLFGNQTQTEANFSLTDLILNNYSLFCGLMILFAAGFLLAGFNLKKHKEWSRKWMVIQSSLIVALIWILIIGFVLQTVEVIFVQIGAVFFGLIWSTPLVLLMRYLNKQKVRVHFS